MTFFELIILINITSMGLYGGIVLDICRTLHKRRKMPIMRARRHAEVAVTLIPASILFSVVWVLYQFWLLTPTEETLQWHFPLALVRVICGIIAVVLIFESRRQERRLMDGTATGN